MSANNNAVAPAAMMPDIMGLPRHALAEHLEAVSIGRHLEHLVFRALHGNGMPLNNHPQFGVRNWLRLQASGHFALASMVDETVSDDGTQKLLLKMMDGADIEAVLIPGEGRRVTLCLSSQVGCGIGCHFCATAQMGRIRNLSAGEMIAQIHIANRLLKATKRRVSHVVFMGMGEPMQNYEAVRDTIQILTDRRGPCIEGRKITVSTVGLPKQMKQFGTDFKGSIQLALSLHAGTDETRKQIIPLASRYDLATLKLACLDHPLPGSRRLMLEYVILPGVNDHPHELEALTTWTRGLKCIVNLVPFNPFKGAVFQAPTVERCKEVLGYLRARNVASTIRRPRGRSVQAACGQLALAAQVQQNELVHIRT